MPIDDGGDYAYSMVQAPDFGIFSLSLTEAADLIALDMWLAEEVESNPKMNVFDTSSNDPKLRIALSDTASIFLQRLENAIELGRLEAPVLTRDFEEKIIPTLTRVMFDDLDLWLCRRNYIVGEAFEDWQETQKEIQGLIMREVVALKAVSFGGKKALKEVAFHQDQFRDYPDDHDPSDPKSVLVALRSHIAENIRLKEQIANISVPAETEIDRPLTKRARRTLLTLLAAVCSKAGIDTGARGAAQRIKELTELMGTSVDDGTISKILLEIPDAVDSRKS